MKKNFVILILFLLFLNLLGCTQNEKYNITYISIEEKSLELEIGEIIDIYIDYDGCGDYSDLEFTISNQEIINLSGNIITAMNIGQTTIQVCAKSDKALKDSFIVYVSNKGEEKKFVRVTAPTHSMMIGHSMDLNIGNLESLNANNVNDFKFSTSDASIVKIDNNKVTALKNGSCTIYATQISNPINIGEFEIYVGLQSNDKTTNGEPTNTPLVGFFDDGNFIIDANKDEQINILGANNLQRYRYNCSDENILLISDTGLFMGVTDGEVIVNIISKDGSQNTSTSVKIKVTGTRNRNYIPILLEIALKEEGYREWTNNNDTKYGEWNNCNYESWCATFVSWCLNNAGVPKSIVIRSISVRVYETTYRAKNQFFLKGEYQPQPGDLIIFSSAGASHIGIVVKSDDKYVYTIEGNTSNMVAQRSYSLSEETITGYIKPNYN